jgi:hypothetical protein
MRKLLYVLCVASGMCVASGSIIHAAAEFDPAALPKDRKVLEKLSDEQLWYLRRTVRGCNEENRPQHNGSPCVMATLDNYIRQYGSPALKALHFSLLPNERYNEARWPNAVEHLNPARKP